jgi:hypothetical protein
MKKSTPAAGTSDTPGIPVVVDRATFQAKLAMQERCWHGRHRP